MLIIDMVLDERKGERMEIREYRPTDEISWVRCRVLAFLDTAYFDNVLQQKEKYENPSIELVAVGEGEIVGLLDVEYEKVEQSVCSRGKGLGGMIWHIAVHPEFRRQGIGEKLLEEAENRAIALGLNRFEAWTRDDYWVQNWYKKMDFQSVESYHHVYLEGNEVDGVISTSVSDLNVVHSFAHYTGDNIVQFRETNSRIHECICFEKYFHA